MAEQAYVRKSTQEDVEFLASRLREIDAAEVEALSGRDPAAVLSQGLEDSDPCMTIMSPSGEPVAMFGVVPMSPGLGSIWLLGTDKLEHKDVVRTFLRYCRRWVEGLGKRYPVMFNYVHFSNKKTIRWLRWLGFEFQEDPRILGAKAEPFYMFTRKPQCANPRP